MWDRFFRQRAYMGITRSRMQWYVRKIFPTASLHMDHSISYALVCEKEISYMGWQPILHGQRWEKYVSCSRTQGSVEPAAPRSRVKHSTCTTEPLCSLNNFKPEKINVGPLAPHRAPIKDSDQTARMRRLFWVLDWRTRQFVPYAIRWLINPIKQKTKRQSNVARFFNGMLFIYFSLFKASTGGERCSHI